MKMYARILVLAALAIFSAGCSTVVVVNRTVGLPGLTPLASADQVKLVEEGTPVSQPYQPVGVVTVSEKFWDGPKAPSEDYSYRRMKKYAADMGADGVIGVHIASVANKIIVLRSGLAVKWLTPGEIKSPVKKPFVVALLPVVVNPEVPLSHTTPAPTAGKNRTAETPMKPVDKQSAWTAAVNEAVRGPLELKGYYVLPPESATYKGGLEGARDLNEAELANLGGDNAHLLLEVAVLNEARATIVVSSSAAVTVKTTLMDKATRKDVFQGTGTGTVSLGWIANMIIDKRSAAAAGAAVFALDTIDQIGEKVEEK